MHEACVAELLKSAGINDHYSDLSEDEKCPSSLGRRPVFYQRPSAENLNCLKRISDFPEAARGGRLGEREVVVYHFSCNKCVGICWSGCDVERSQT